MDTLTFVVSDLHVGSRYFYWEHFLGWLDALPPGAGLILNGDIIDEPRKSLTPQHQVVLQRLVEESCRRPVIWILGNHDKELVLEQTGQIQFVPRWELDRRLLVAHGDGFDELMPRHPLFKAVVRLAHRLRIWLGAPDVHVACYAKKWGFFYRALNEQVAGKALRLASAGGFQAVTCGHTHAAMALEQDGVQYFNTGAWTEEPHYFLEVNGTVLCLRQYGEEGA